jgi:hypothetical protein
LAMHSDSSVLQTQPGRELQHDLQKNKHRFRQAYERILSDERREARLTAQRNELNSRLTRENDEHARKVEKVRLERLAQDLAREAESRRARRRAREEALIRTMFTEAFEVERARILSSRAQQAEEQFRRDKAMLERYEAAKKHAQDRLDLVTEAVEEDRKRKQDQRKHRQESLRVLATEMKNELASKLSRAKAEMDAREEDELLVNTEGITRAFALLSETSREFARLSAGLA